MNNPETSVIIRTRNEARWLDETLRRLERQTYQNFEVVIVDSGSTDRTLAIAHGHAVHLIEISPDSFTYPYALNVGAKASRADKYLVLLSAHSLPIGIHWLESAVAHLKTRKDVMGVYGPQRALPDGTVWDKFFYGLGYFLHSVRSFPRTYRIVEEAELGVLGFTNSLIRKELWEQEPFDEQYAGGGEDTVWANYWFRRGLVAIKDSRFAVLHSHYLSLRGWVQQRRHWIGNATPQPFVRLAFRKDGAHHS